METKRNKILEFVVNVIFGLSLIGFFVAFNFSDKMNGWHQQFLPAGINNNINNLVFTDSLTGYIALASDNNGNGYILKTSNGGDNWNILSQNFNAAGFQDLQFLNKDTAIMQDVNYIYKTTNAGVNWNTKPNPVFTHLYAYNLDTIFGADDQPVIGGFWRTTNGGTSWVKLVNFGSMNPEGVYFYNKNIGYINRGGGTWKTTNGGFNWFQISGNYGDMYFIDSLLGYKAAIYIMSKTTNGGLNWTDQQLPNTALPGVIKFFAINKDTLWSIGGSIIKNNTYYGIVYKTTNGGNNWGYQIPLDTNTIDQYRNIQGFNKMNVWGYYLRNTGVHTNVGGNDTTIFTGINSNITGIPDEYVLYQNYPNPFNQSSIIKYQLSIAGTISIKVFDIQGKEIMTLVNERKTAGKYEVRFDGGRLSSGIYFYALFADGKRIDTKKMLLLK